jgi:hypothetical protein
MYDFDERTAEDWDFVFGPVVISPCGRHVYAACCDGSVVDIEVGAAPPKVIYRYPVPEQRYLAPYGQPLDCLDISSDGRILVGTCANSILIWMTDNRHFRRRYEREAVIKQMKFVSGRRIMIVDANGNGTLVDTLTGRDVAILASDALSGEPILTDNKSSKVAIRVSGGRLICCAVFPSPFELFDHLRMVRPQQMYDEPPTG